MSTRKEVLTVNNTDIRSGIVIKAIAGFCYVETGNEIFECKVRGINRKRQVSPVAGDIVDISVAADKKGMVEKISERRNFLVRPPIANVDKMLIVSSHDTPAPNALVIDRMIAIAEDKEITPVIVFNKCDNGSFSEWEKIYKDAGYKTLVVSSKTGEGIDALKKELSGESVTVFTGNSGVGKSSLINCVFEELCLRTGEVSEKLGRGRHTTRTVELFKSESGGYVADTPGFSSIDLQSSNIVYKENIQFCFKEFQDYIGECRFSSCTHTGEKGCAIAEAVERGDIGQSRYKSYCSLYDEIKDLKEWEIRSEKR
jgi:ribosome biogenesis GTPase